MEKSDETARFIANMQQERSIALMLTFLDEDFDAETKKINFNIEEQMLKTDVALENISDWRAPVGVEILRQAGALEVRNLYITSPSCFALTYAIKETEKERQQMSISSQSLE